MLHYPRPPWRERWHAQEMRLCGGPVSRQKALARPLAKLDWFQSGPKRRLAVEFSERPPSCRWVVDPYCDSVCKLLCRNSACSQEEGKVLLTRTTCATRSGRCSRTLACQRGADHPGHTLMSATLEI